MNSSEPKLREVTMFCIFRQVRIYPSLNAKKLGHFVFLVYMNNFFVILVYLYSFIV